MNKISKVIVTFFLCFLCTFFKGLVFAKEYNDLDKLMLNLLKMPSDVQKEILYPLILKVKDRLKDYLLSKKTCFGCQRAFSNGICTCTFTPDGKNLVIGLNDGSIELWDVEKELKFLKKVKCFEENIPVSYILFDSSSKKFAVSSCLKAAVKIFDFSTFKVLKNLECENYISFGAFNTKGNLFAFEFKKNLVKHIGIYDFLSAKIKIIKLCEADIVPGEISFSRDDTKLFVYFKNDRLYYLDLVDGMKLKNERYLFHIDNVSFRKDCKKKILYFKNGLARISDTIKLKESKDFFINIEGLLYNIFFSNEGSRFITFSCVRDSNGSFLNLWHKDKLLSRFRYKTVIINKNHFSFSLDATKLCFLDVKRNCFEVFYLYNPVDKEILSYFDSIHKLKANQMFLLYLLFKNSIGVKGKGMNLALTKKELIKKYGYNEFLDLKKSYNSLPEELKKFVQEAFFVKA